MKAKLLLVSLLIFAASQGQAATVLTSDGISWTGNVTGIGTPNGTITLHADTSGADFNGGVEAFLAGIELKPVGGNQKKQFNITSISLPGWDFTNSLLNRAGTTCHESQASWGTH